MDARIFFKETEICTGGGKESFPFGVFEGTVLDEIGLFRMCIEGKIFIAFDECFDVENDIGIRYFSSVRIDLFRGGIWNQCGLTFCFFFSLIRFDFGLFLFLNFWTNVHHIPEDEKNIAKHDVPQGCSACAGKEKKVALNKMIDDIQVRD